MAITYAGNKTTAKATTKVLGSLVFGAVCGTAVGVGTSWALAPLAGWAIASASFLSWIWLDLSRLDSKLTAEYAVREDPSRAAADSVVLIASIASLAAVAAVLVESGTASGGKRIFEICLSVVSVVLSWTLVHTLFMLRYAELYYTTPRGGVDFGDTKQPTYADFAYLAFTLGMTFQVSDTALQSSKFRSTALRHSLLSYLFGTVIVAMTINLVAGLSK